jgi:short-subunit dehydrogenase
MTSRLDEIDTALVTGASQGIGEAFARHLAARGKDLILVARTGQKLRTLSQELASAHGVSAHVVVADLSYPDSAVRLQARTQDLGLAVDLLINNAGFAKQGDFVQLPLAVQSDMVRLNANTPLELARLYLPEMRGRGRGGIINVASTAAFQPVPYMAAYGATKAFMLSLSTALAEEVAADGVHVMVLCPGATATNFWTMAGAAKTGTRWTVSADKLVRDALRAYGRGRRVFVHGGINRLVAACVRILPARFITYSAARVLRAGG